MTKTKEHKELKLIEGERYTFTASFEGVDEINNRWFEDTPIVWLNNVKEAETGELVSTRLWVNKTQEWDNVDAKAGDKIICMARYSPNGKKYPWVYTVERINNLNRIKVA